MAALGSLAGEKWRIKKSIQAVIKFFDPIKQPGPKDHLFLYEEDGQSFPLYTSIMKNYIDLEKEIIYIGLFYCKLSKERVSWIRKQVTYFFWGVKVKVHHIPELPLDAFGEMTS